jgi:hypothetical protein
MPYQKASDRITSRMKNAMAPDGKNFSFFCGVSIIVDFNCGTKLKAGLKVGYDLPQPES